MNYCLRSLSIFLLLAVAVGCSNDDDEGVNNPPGGSTGDPVTEAMISQGLAITNAMFAMAPQWTSGELFGPPAKDAIFDPSCQCWLWQVIVGDPFANPFDYTMWDFRATFFAGETVVPNPQDADRVMIAINYSWFAGFYPMDGMGDNRSTIFIAAITLSITPVGGDPVEVSGGGVAEFTSTGSDGGAFFEEYGEFIMAMNLSLPLAGCPSGSVTLEEGLTLFSISYDGTATAFWSLSQGEAGNTIRGSETVPCGATK